MKTVFVLCHLFAYFVCSSAIGQGTPKTPFATAILKTLEWSDDLQPYSLEITATNNRKSTFPKGTMEDFGETIDKIQEFRAINDQFVVAAANGFIQIMKVEGKEQIDEGTLQWYFFGDKENVQGKSMRITGEIVDNAITNCGPNGKDCLDACRKFELARLPFYTTMNLAQSELENDTAILLARFLEQKTWHEDRVRIGKDKESLVYRFSYRINDTLTFAYRVTVSDSGFDKGYVTEISRFKMKKEEAHKPYTDDEQVRPSLLNSNTITWKELETSHGKRICLVKVVQDNQSGNLMRTTKFWNLDWKSFSNPNANTITEENCQKICTDFAKQIDKALGR